MHVKFDSPSSSSKGSCEGFLSYMEKEDKEKGVDKEMWFNDKSDLITKKEIKNNIDVDQKLEKGLYRYYTGSVSFSEKELLFLKNDKTKIKLYLKSLIEIYAKSFDKDGVDASNIRMYFKLEDNRYLSNREVKTKGIKSGKKPGLNTHAHFIVGRRSIDNKFKLSPISNHRGGDHNAGAIQSGFNRSNFFQQCEYKFDNFFLYPRAIDETYKHLNEKSKPHLDKKKIIVNTDIGFHVHQKYAKQTIDEKTKSINKVLGYMAFRKENSIKLDRLEIHKLAKENNYDGKVYKALLNLNLRAKEGFHLKGNAYEYIKSFLEFGNRPYSELPKDLKEDKIISFTNYLNKQLKSDQRIDLVKTLKLEEENNYNGITYRALNKINKSLQDGNNIENPNVQIKKFVEQTPQYSNNQNFNVGSKSSVIQTILSTQIKTIDIVPRIDGFTKEEIDYKQEEYLLNKKRKRKIRR